MMYTECGSNHSFRHEHIHTEKDRDILWNELMSLWTLSSLKYIGQVRRLKI